MIKPNELRIGNWYLVDQNDLPNDLFYQFTHWELAETFLYKCSPIPLTYDLLIKCGFIDPVNNRWGCRISINESREIAFYIQDSGYVRYQSKGSGFTEALMHVSNLHMLQNFYFNLTGVELKVKL